MYIRKSRSTIYAAFAILFLLLPIPVSAQSLQVSWIDGPRTVDLGDELAQIEISDAYSFANENDTRLVMERMGNPPTNLEVGMIVPKDELQNWFLLFEFVPIGYVPDDEKENLDADTILKSITQGTAEANKIRLQRDIPSLKIKGWYEEPHYNEQTNNLVWTTLLEQRISGKTQQVVNYNIRLLGRTGYMSVVLVTSPDKMDTLAPEAEKILSKFSFKSGKTYAEYIPGDKLANIGLTALVAGGAGAVVAKSGLAKVIAKFGKFIFLAFFALLSAVWQGIKSLFSGSSNKQTHYARTS